MKLDSVFVAFLNDGKEHLLYKKDDEIYVDLNSKAKYTIDDIDESTLLYFNDVLYCCGKDKSKYGIRRLYNNDRKALIDTSLLYIVKLRQVSDLIKQNLSDSLSLYKWNAKYLYKSILIKNCTGSFSDPRNEKVYLEPNTCIFENGTIYVDESNKGDVIPLSQKINYYGSLEKSKILSLSYKLNNK